MNILFFDTETTGFPDFKARHGDPSQPHLVQLASLLATDQGEVLDQFCSIIDPRGHYLDMPKEAAAAHGITYERALTEGIDLSVALRKFNRLAAKAQIAVAHNKNFDMKVLRIAWTRASMWPQKDPFLVTECSMELAKPLVRLPPTAKMLAARRTSFKPPSLGEAYEFFMGEPLVNAHDAGVDTLACMKVYFAAKAMIHAQAQDEAEESLP